MVPSLATAWLGHRVGYETAPEQQTDTAGWCRLVWPQPSQPGHPSSKSESQGFNGAWGTGKAQNRYHEWEREGYLLKSPSESPSHQWWRGAGGTWRRGQGGLGVASEVPISGVASRYRHPRGLPACPGVTEDLLVVLDQQLHEEAQGHQVSRRGRALRRP